MGLVTCSATSSFWLNVDGANIHGDLNGSGWGRCHGYASDAAAPADAAAASGNNPR